MISSLRALVWVLLVASVLIAPVGIASELKIAFVNATLIVDRAPQAEEARKRLEEEFAPRDRDLVRMQGDVRDAEEQLSREAITMNQADRDRSSMSEVERRKMERELLSLKRELKRAQEEFREDLNIRRNEEFAKLQSLVAEVISTIAREQQYDLILNEGAVIYASDRVDATEIVLGRLKEQQ